jgi:hypothetical protein
VKVLTDLKRVVHPSDLPEVADVAADDACEVATLAASVFSFFVSV